MKHILILESKGYDATERDGIIGSLDWMVRYAYSIKEPIHLLDDGYYYGDADAEVLNNIAASKGYEDYTELFGAMDRSLTDLAERWPSKN